MVSLQWPCQKGGFDEKEEKVVEGGRAGVVARWWRFGDAQKNRAAQTNLAAQYWGQRWWASQG